MRAIPSQLQICKICNDWALHKRALMTLIGLALASLMDLALLIPIARFT